MMLKLKSHLYGFSIEIYHENFLCWNEFLLLKQYRRLGLLSALISAQFLISAIHHSWFCYLLLSACTQISISVFCKLDNMQNNYLYTIFWSTSSVLLLTIARRLPWAHHGHRQWLYPSDGMLARGSWLVLLSTISLHFQHFSNPWFPDSF